MVRAVSSEDDFVNVRTDDKVRLLIKCVDVDGQRGYPVNGYVGIVVSEERLC